MNAWIENLEIGDKVIVCPHFGQNYVNTVKRITKTLIITKDNSRFTKKWCSNPGDSWSPTSIKKYSSEKEQKINDQLRKNGIINKIRITSFNEFSLNTLEKINNLIRVKK